LQKKVPTINETRLATFCGNITSTLNVSCVAADIAMFAREASSSLLQSALDLVPKRSRLISSMFLLFFLQLMSRSLSQLVLHCSHVFSVKCPTQ